MRKVLSFLLLVLSAITVNSQIGVGTTSPNSTFDLRGSLATPITTFSSSTSAGTTDNFLVFTGSSVATLTLPSAATITGREYWIKNSSSNGSALTINTTSSQTIDGAASWSLSQTNKVIRLVSNGSNWYAASESLPGNSAGTGWLLGGNNTSSLQNIGTTSNYALPFITNGTERMRISASGNAAIGTTTWDATNPEKLLVDAGITSSFNVISGKGTINNYLQLNIQNKSAGASASSDIVATADNGNESVNYVDIGINSSGYSTSGILGGANNVYLYGTGNDFVIGNSTSNKDLVFFTNGTSTSNERMRIESGGNVGIGITSPNYLLHLHKSGANSNWMQITNGSTGTGTYDGFFYGVSASGQPQIWGAGDLAIITGSGTTNNYTMTLSEAGNVAINNTNFDASNPERLLVDAGTTSSFNVISGKGSINNYLQLNIQNKSSGNAASSDVVATADNGTESVNFIDMGINSSGYSTSGILGGVNNGYLYTTGNDLIIGNATASKNLVFFTGGTATTNERLRITGTGMIGIGDITPVSTLEVNGSVGAAIATTSANLTLDATNHTVIITGGTPVITLPSAASSTRRIYVVVNQTLTSRTISSYKDYTGSSDTLVPGFSSITVQSNGTNWYRIQ
jgi:hypothetical protein